jgi:hypothetical protein
MLINKLNQYSTNNYIRSSKLAAITYEFFTDKVIVTEFYVNS